MNFKRHSKKKVAISIQVVATLPFTVDESKPWVLVPGNQHIVYIEEKSFSEGLEKQRVLGHDVFASIKNLGAEARVENTSVNLFAFIEGLLLSSYQFNRFLTKKKQTNLLNTVELPSSFSDEALSAMVNATDLVFWARDMVNLPVSHLNAIDLAQHMVEISQIEHCKSEVFSQSKIESLKMGGLIAVNKGSIDPPTFTVLEYNPPKALNQNPIVLVGKGVVYDTGGLSLKPTPGSMDSMKCDMAGAAMMAAAFALTAIQKVPLKLVCIVPATDNRPGGNAYTPGDIITMFNGSTVEVLNTDAEGRMILADALSYSEKFSPELVISAATLTGAAARAIGSRAAIAMGNAKAQVMTALKQAGDDTHERIVEFPFWDEYLDDMKSPIADLKNIGGPEAGMITAGKFLETFLSAPYVHIDIAGPAWLDAPKDYKGKGGTGFGVRLIHQFLSKYGDWSASKTKTK